MGFLKNILVILLAVQVCFTQDFRVMKLIKLEPKYGAKCLDGSPTSIYYRKGIDAGENKFIFNFQGGAWCGQSTEEETIADCIERSKTDLGSSDDLSSFKYYDGLFSTNPEFNPIFSQYNFVFLNYCDGTGHQGYSEESYTDGESTVWFRGKANTLTAFEYAMENLGMKNAEQVIISGQSAGGLACYSWTDELEKRIKSSNKNVEIFAHCDSALFMNFENMQTKSMKYESQIKGFMAFSNKVTPPINQKCVEAYPNQWWKCMFSQYLLEFVDTKTMISNSEYDTWSLKNIAGVDCIKNFRFQDCTDAQLQQAEAYRNYYIQNVSKIMEKKDNFSLWSPACLKHVFDLDTTFYNKKWRVPEGSDNNVNNMLTDLIQGKKQTIRYDDEPWPSNLPCSRVPTSTTITALYE